MTNNQNFQDKQSFYIIDGHAYSYHAFYAINYLHSPDGLPTNAIFGFMKMLDKIIEERQPDYLAVCFDLHAPTFRHDMFTEYKANRKPMPEDLRVQIPLIKEVISSYNIPIFQKEGFEADDVMSTIARLASEKGVDAYILTPDKDMGQVITDNVFLYNYKKRLIVDKHHIKKEFKLAPTQLPDYFALVGDAVDNIPGVKGIGPKKSSKLIGDWENLEKLYENIENIQPKRTRDLLLENKENAFLSKKLFLINDKVDFYFDFDSCIMQEKNKEKFIELCTKYGFKSYIASFAADITVDMTKQEVIKTNKRLSEVVSLLEKEDKVFIDIETNNKHIWDLELLSISLYKDKMYHIPLSAFEKDKVWDILSPLLSQGPSKIAYDLKYLFNVLMVHGIILYPMSFDVKLAGYILAPSDRQPSLEELVLQYLALKVPNFPKKKDILEKSRYYFSKLLLVERLLKQFKGKLDDVKRNELLFDLEMPLIPILSEMELSGILLDIDVLKQLHDKLSKQIDELQEKIYKEAGVEFNIASSQQLASILFDKLGLSKGKKTKTGYSTDAKVLEELTEEHIIAKLVIQYRKLQKLLNTYIDVLPKLVHPKTHRIHTSFHQTGTATGRLSSSDPNLQNIPIRTDIGQDIRRSFIAPKDHVLLSADYSQIELRILAHFSGDEKLMSSFQNGEDIHTNVAATIFDVTPEEVNSYQRSVAKSVNFGIIYGQTPYGLSKELGIEVKEASCFIDAYFENYKGVRAFIDKTIEQTKETRFVKTLLGRVRYLPDIGAANHNVMKFAERAAVNTIMQGSAADIIKKSMIDIYNFRNDKMLNFKMLLQIHDELIFEVASNDVAQIRELLRTTMIETVKLSVPLEVNISSGINWKQASK